VPQRAAISLNVTQGPWKLPAAPHVVCVQLLLSEAHVVLFNGSMAQAVTVQLGGIDACRSPPDEAPTSPVRLDFVRFHLGALPQRDCPSGPMQLAALRSTLGLTGRFGRQAPNEVSMEISSSPSVRCAVFINILSLRQLWMWSYTPHAEALLSSQKAAS
jgi:hypothetical protein